MSDPPPPPGPSKPNQEPNTRTRRTRPSSARPDTAASGISILPDQQFFPEGEDFEEDEEEYDDDEPEEEDVFAFARPKTSAAPKGGAFSDYTGSAPTTSRGAAPTTAGTYISTGTSGFAQTPGTSAVGEVKEVGDGSTPDIMKGVGFVDAGGQIPELTYDKENPPPMSGVHNPNNSSFAWMKKLHDQQGHYNSEGKTSSTQHRPPTSKSFLSRLQRRGQTATTDGSGTTTDDEDGVSSYGTESYMGTTTTKSRIAQPRRTRSSAPLIPSTAGTGITGISGTETSMSGATSSRGFSRGSIGMTEMSGDMTVPDGRTTWGDGMMPPIPIKEGSEAGSIGMDLNLTEEDSPYPEVRASVSNIDDPEMPAMTLRSFTLGLFFCILASMANTFFHFRTPSIFISPFMIQVIVYPFGKFAAWTLPITVHTLPKYLGGAAWSFNPGPFNIKEHTLIVMMANVAIGPSYALYATVSSEIWYARDFGVGFTILLILSTQLTGFCFAGLSRRFVVWPASMIWPNNLVVATNLNTFHAEDEGFQGGVSRFRFLIYVGVGAFCWMFIPGFLFTALSYFSWACWIAPSNSVVNQLFGVSTGLGMSFLTFDWTQVTWTGSPLITPWWAQVNIAIGFVLFFWIVTPVLYFTNVWQTSYLPINVVQTADRFGNSYDVFQVLTPESTLNITAYAEYSPVYLSASFSVTFMIAFALSTAVLVHTALHHGPRIYKAVTNVKIEADDIHMKLMRQYPEVPDWWFATLFVFCFIFAVVCIEVYKTELPVWGYLMCVLLPALYILPAAFIYAMTNQQIAVNLIAELIPGYIFQGKPIPGMIFKTFSVASINQGLSFTQDQKLGHYMKIPPRATFIAQLCACSICCFVQAGTKVLLFATVENVCGSHQKDLLTCASTKVFFTSSVIWGLIGPARLFSNGSLYHPQTYAALVGAILPIPLWFWVKKYPRSIFRNMSIPVIFSGRLWIPPATGINYTSFFMVGFVFQFWIRRRNFAWWSKYNYVLSVGLDVGTALSVLFIFTVLGLTGATLNWWGNTVHTQTADWNGVGATRLIPPDSGFGPDTWQL